MVYGGLIQTGREESSNLIKMHRCLVLLLALCLAAVHVAVAQSPVPAEGGESPPEAPQSPEAPAAEDVEGTDAEEDVGDVGTDAPDGTDAPGEGTAAPVEATTAAPDQTTPGDGCAAIVANSLLVFSTAALLLTRQ
ncbi:uncharacterized protein LOC144876214 [Branchiostoma floridae x Branchiostoma japonicum]